MKENNINEINLYQQNIQHTPRPRCIKLFARFFFAIEKLWQIFMQIVMGKKIAGVSGIFAVKKLRQKCYATGPNTHMHTNYTQIIFF